MKLLLCFIVVMSIIACADETAAKDNITQLPEYQGPNYNDESEEQAESVYMSQPSSDAKMFTLDDEFSCEFDAMPNTQHWEIPDDFNFAAWSFSKDNGTVEDGVLSLTLSHSEHKSPNGQKQFYFKSGMMRSLKTSTYGFYEAKIKGAPMWPGSCTAFWLYSRVAKDKVVPQMENTLSYNEIDVIEIQQYANDKQYLASNLHLYALESNGAGGFNNVQYKAGKYNETMQTKYHITDYWDENGGWHAEDDYHIYACENRPDSIVFYVDNVRVGAKPNYYWHMGMHITLSLGLRTPYEKYDSDGTRYGVPITEQEAKAAGFPASMEVEYVRTYRRADGYSSFQSSKKAFDPNDLAN